MYVRLLVVVATSPLEVHVIASSTPSLVGMNFFGLLSYKVHGFPRYETKNIMRQN
jgi:hypothetical protein